jgi:hypothetical protein
MWVFVKSRIELVTNRNDQKPSFFTKLLGSTTSKMAVRGTQAGITINNLLDHTNEGK